MRALQHQLAEFAAPYTVTISIFSDAKTSPILQYRRASNSMLKTVWSQAVRLIFLCFLEKVSPKYKCKKKPRHKYRILFSKERAQPVKKRKIIKNKKVIDDKVTKSGVFPLLLLFAEVLDRCVGVHLFFYFFNRFESRAKTAFIYTHTKNWYILLRCTGTQRVHFVKRFERKIARNGLTILFGIFWLGMPSSP